MSVRTVQVCLHCQQPFERRVATVELKDAAGTPARIHTECWRRWTSPVVHSAICRGDGQGPPSFLRLVPNRGW